MDMDIHMVIGCGLLGGSCYSGRDCAMIEVLCDGNIGVSCHTRGRITTHGTSAESGDAIDLLHKSHIAPVQYPTMHHFVTEMCTCVHISVTKLCIVVYLSNALWDLWNWFINVTLLLMHPSCISFQNFVMLHKIKLNIHSYKGSTVFYTMMIIKTTHLHRLMKLSIFMIITI